MSASTSTLRQAWKAFECRPEKMQEIAFGPDRIKVAPPTVPAWRALYAVFDAHGYNVRVGDTDSYCCRAMKDQKQRSLHSFGIALDVNWNTNPWRDHTGKRAPRFSGKPTQTDRASDVKLGAADTDMTEAMITDVLAIRTLDGKQVFEWGGNWRSVKDAMHFEIDLTPDELAVGIDPATVRGPMAGFPAVAQAPGASPAAEDAIMADTFDTDELARPAVPMAARAAPAANQFALVQPVIDKWEGGYVDHPKDPGGATNMGITIATLSNWRGQACSKADVKALSRAEAWKIMKAGYYDVVCGDDLPLPVAVAVHNCAVLSGPSRAAKFLQRALGQLGAKVEVDGVVGPETLGAVAQVDARALAQTFFDIQLGFLKGLKHWPVFGKGWTNRLQDVRHYALTVAPAPVPVAVGAQPEPTIPTTPEVPTMPIPYPIPMPVPTATQQWPGTTPQAAAPAAAPAAPGDPTAAIMSILSAVMALRQATAAPPAPVAPTAQTDPLLLLQSVLSVLGQTGVLKGPPAGTVPAGTVPPAKPGETPLTPVNAALGSTIGRALNGNKTVIGTVGMLATTLLPAIGAVWPPAAGIGAAVQAAAPIALPILSALTGWGVLGKLDKWRVADKAT